MKKILYTLLLSVLMFSCTTETPTPSNIPAPTTTPTGYIPQPPPTPKCGIVMKRTLRNIRTNHCNFQNPNCFRTVDKVKVTLDVDFGRQPNIIYFTVGTDLIYGELGDSLLQYPVGSSYCK